MKYLIAGLGNIGPEYEVTRHNIGFLVLDRLADLQKVSFDQDRHAFVSEVKYKGRSLNLIKPTTYMNLSGKAISYWLNHQKIDRKNLLVITDDVSLPFGKLRLKPRGSSGGHNGLKNIEEVLGTQEYPRLKFGIGDDYPKGRQVDYVLSPFSKQEFETLTIEIDTCIDMIYAFCTIGIERTMNQFN